MRVLGILPIVLALIAFPSAACAQKSNTQMQAEVLDKIIAQEQAEMESLRQYSPLVETYVQIRRPDKHMGVAPSGDKYFLGRAVLAKGIELEPLARDTRTKHNRLLGSVTNLLSMEFLPRGFLQMIYLDTNGFDRTHYEFSFVRREFLGDVRCLVFDVDPRVKSEKGRFVGRIWVEDQDLHIVRFNGIYNGSSIFSYYFSFDSWRQNAGKNEWLPAFIFSEDHAEYRGAKKEMIPAFRAQTRFWGGEVDKTLELVVNNLEVTNGLDIQPQVRCRVLMTSTFESYAMGHTIVLSRGLLDVLPDEASLAALLAHELGHIVLGHRMDTQFAFFDRLRFVEKDAIRRFAFTRPPEEELAANQKGSELLMKSPYKDQLATADIFLQALKSRSKEIPNLISPHLGDRMPTNWTIAPSAPSAQTPKGKTADAPEAASTIALPLGGRIKVDPFSGHLHFLKFKSASLAPEFEKMPFEVTPVFLYLTRQNDDTQAQKTAE